MNLQQSTVDFLLGRPPRARTRYLLAAAGVTLAVALLPSDWVDAYVWVAGTVAVSIAFVAGLGGHGVSIGFLGTAPYVAVVHDAAFLYRMGGGIMVVPLLSVLVVATTLILVPGYLLGIAVRDYVWRRL